MARQPTFGVMTDQPDNLVLTLLRDMRASQQRIEEKLDELVLRVSSVESNLAQVHVELAGIHVDLASHAARMDRMDRRLDRIERRLGLIDA
jgi:archaellum component FlaC